jgi:hypothetical protein
MKPQNIIYGRIKDGNLEHNIQIADFRYQLK